MTLAPYIQTYLAHSHSNGGCGCLPVPFERAAPHSWIRPCFDSDILENQFKINSFRQFTKRFRYVHQIDKKLESNLKFVQFEY